jgi:hypothetical protein
MNKKYDFKIKRINGNTTIVVLIISFVIILAMTTLVGYMFRDIIFTRFDEGKFKALNIAEAGLADMYSNIEKFYNEEITSLPSSGYSKDVANSDGDIQGNFTITYDRIYNDDGELTNYIINSEGTDLESGETREVRVNLGVSFSTEVNIFDYIYSRGSITFDDLTIIEGNPFFNGPTYVRGNVTLRLLEGRYFSGGGKILIGGNLDMGEWAELEEAGPINVGGNVEMSGRAYLEHDFDEYMIVMRDIRMTGNSQIGESSGNPINLCCEGVIDAQGGSHIYYNLPLGDEIFDPPNFDSSVYVNNFMVQIQEPPTDFLEIDESEDGVDDDVFVIDPDLILAAVPPAVSDSTEESVKLMTSPYILVTKNASPNVAEVGDVITYAYTVTNISSDILTAVTCVDSSLGAVTLAGLTDEDGDGDNDDLAIGAAAAGTLSYTVTSGDLPGPISNTAVALCIPMIPVDEFYKVDGDNSIRFYEDGGSYYLEVEGNVLIDDDIRIGEEIEDSNIDPPDNDIYYSGKGKLITAGNIDASCGLVPADVSDFPEESLLILMTPGNLDININNDSSCYNNFYGDHEDPDLYILGIAGGTVTFSRHTAVLGSILAGQINADDLSGLLGWLIGSFATVGYQDGLSDYIPEDMPMLYYGGPTFTEEWQEVID